MLLFQCVVVSMCKTSNFYQFPEKVAVFLCLLLHFFVNANLSVLLLSIQEVIKHILSDIIELCSAAEYWGKNLNILYHISC